ncbi:type II toxin-antitoxin system VapC family toxin [Sphingomonas sp.]|uniref:type II toxin-antitoxin system VapC family toxin n=1 Tax=Sphingomonas sp. TaxID=28214 RepID=UPI00286CEF07|nr:type II toxin-antitoxin system VapC family toxin [Sphingomonas sp.]
MDTSVIVAMLQLEPDATELLRLLSRSSDTRISAGTFLECGIVIDSAKDPQASANLDALIGNFRIRIEPVTETQARLARQAYRDFGKGSGHSAQLNFGDCFAYALAIERGEPLLFKGNDFTQTGIARA